jgi:hypothetical protein
LDPIIGELKMVTDGDKECSDGSFVELMPGRQWVQIDLKGPSIIHAILLWRGQWDAVVYHDVVIQVADDPGFTGTVRTVFNNDYDNSAGLGLGKNLEYIESHEGRLIDCKGVIGRYVRLYSRGNTQNDMNHYIEVEVHGQPISAPASSAALLEIKVDLLRLESILFPPATTGLAPLTTRLPHEIFY